MELTGDPGISAETLVVMFAVPEEARPFLRAWRRFGEKPQRINLDSQNRRISAWRFSAGHVWVSGIGRRNAARAADQALEGAPTAPTTVLTCGFAGGLNPALPTGTIVLDADPDFAWENSLKRAGAATGRFVCVDKVVVTAEAKATLRQQTQADAVEMESGVIREFCRSRRIPAATVRVISDAAHETLPLDFGALMTSDDQIHFGKLARVLLRSPGKIRELLRFQRQISFAANQLAQTLILALRESR